MKTIKKDIGRVLYPPRQSEEAHRRPGGDIDYTADLVFDLCDRIASAQGYTLVELKKVTVEMEVLIK